VGRGWVGCLGLGGRRGSGAWGVGDWVGNQWKLKRNKKDKRCAKKPKDPYKERVEEAGGGAAGMGKVRGGLCGGGGAGWGGGGW